MKFEHYVSAMECWKGRVDSETDYDTFRWHQWVRPLDLNEENNPFEGKIGFAFIGFCSEQGVERNKGRVGAALAPDFIRKQMSNLPCTFQQEVKLYDAGNILCHEITLEEGQELLANAVEKICELGLFPIVLGGGHETTLGTFRGLKANISKLDDNPDLSILNFDAHFDLRPYEKGSSSGTMFLQMAEDCKNSNMEYRYMPLGIQRQSNTIKLFKTATELGVNYVLAKNFTASNMAGILEKVDTFLYPSKNAYITICTDVFSSAFAPGVSATQSLGLDPEVVLPVIKHILRTRKVRGFDLCEISPRFDQDNTTANLGAVLVFSVVDTLTTLNGLQVELEYR